MYMEKRFSFTVNVMELNDDSEAFAEWFKTSKYTKEFEVSVSESDDEEVLEIVQHNPFLTADALEEVYRIETGRDKQVCQNCAKEHAEEESTAILEKVKNNTNLN